MAKEDVVKMPPVSVLQKLLAKSKSTKAKMDTLKGDLGEAMSSAVDEHNVHPAAFKLVAKLARMDGVKLMSFLTHFDAYRDKLGIDKLVAEDLPGLDDDEETEETGDEMIQRVAREKAAEQAAIEQGEGAEVLDRSKAN